MDGVAPIDEKAREVRPVRRGTAHVRRPDPGEKERCACVGALQNRRATHRTAPPIIVRPHAQPAARSPEAVGGGSLLSHLPRHRRAVPSARPRSAERNGRDLRHGRRGQPADIALVVLTVLALLRLRSRRTVSAPALLAVSAGFGVLVLLSALPNGASAITAAGKLAELAALTLGAAVFVDTRERLETLLAVIVVYASSLSCGRRPSSSAPAEAARARLWASTTWPRSRRLRWRWGSPG